MNVDLHSEVLVPPDYAILLAESFNFDEYIDTERELWMLFPEIDGLRVNFIQTGLTTWIYAETEKTNKPLERDETYIVMPCRDEVGNSYMRPIRMKAHRRLTVLEFRMAQLTAVKLIGKLDATAHALRELGEEILGSEVIEEVNDRMRCSDDVET